MRRELLRGIASVCASCALLVGCGQIAGLEEAYATARPAGGSSVVEGSVEITTSKLDLGDVTCGTEGKKQFLLLNHGEAAVAYKLRPLDPEAVRLSVPLEGRVEAGAALDVEVFVKPAAAADITTEILVEAPVLAHIAVSARGVGAALSLEKSLADFGEVRMNDTARVEVGVKNTGTRATDVTKFDGETADYKLLWPGMPTPLHLEPGESKPLTIELQKGPASTTDVTTTVAPVASGLCGRAPTVPARAKRINGDITLGTAEWDRVNCGTAPGTRNVVITNYSPKKVTWTASFPATPPPAFTFVGGTENGTVDEAPVGGSRTGIITLAVNDFATPGVRDQTVQVTLTAGTDAPVTRTAKAHIEVRGALVTFDPAALTFSSNGTTTDSKTFKLKNVGNQTLTVPVAGESTNDNDAWSVNFPFTVPAGGEVTGSVSFRSSGASSGTITLDKNLLDGAVYCNPKATLAVKGNSP